MVDQEGGQDRHRQKGRHQILLFYAYDGMVASLESGWLQGDLSTLVGLLDRVVLSKNFGKTVGMVCRTRQAAGTQSENAYKQKITGAGLSYRERQKVMVQCLECGEKIILGSLEVHQQTQHGKAAGGRRNWGTMSPGREPRTYNMDLPRAGNPRNCPIEGYQ